MSTTSSPPIGPTRTNTASSISSQETSNHLTRANTAPSPTERSFFNAIASKVSPRSRSRSRTRSASPVPPSQIDTSAAMHPTSQALPASPGSRTASPQSPKHRSGPPKPPQKRHSSSGSASSGTYTQCGRHSNEWSFNGFSVKETVKGFLERKDS